VKALLKMMDRLRPTFHEGRLKLVRPAFDAIDFFLFSPPEPTETAPHVRGPMSVKRYMSAAIVAVMPCIAVAIYFFGWRVLAMIVTTYVVGLSIELLFAILRKEEINEGFFVTGLLYPLILPPGLPLWMLAVGCAFGVVVGKELFGGTGRNLFNPALVGRCFLLIGYPTAMSSGWAQPGWWGGEGFRWFGRLGQYGADAITGATPLAAAKQGTYTDAWNLLIGNVGGCAGATSSIVIVLGGLFLLVTGVASWRTVVAMLGSFAIVGFVIAVATMDKLAGAGGRVVSLGSASVELSAASFSARAAGAAAATGWHVLAGGLLFGAMFMATDPVTSPISRGAKWAYGAVIGASAILIRYLTGYVEGVMFAILLGNIVAPVLDDVATRVHLRRIRK